MSRIRDILADLRQMHRDCRFQFKQFRCTEDPRIREYEKRIRLKSYIKDRDSGVKRGKTGIPIAPDTPRRYKIDLGL